LMVVTVMLPNMFWFMVSPGCLLYE
jgi:hypothetical protein